VPGRKNLEFGRLAEEEAARFLAARGYRVIGRNYRAGRGEIDIIAMEGETVCFIEVKARHSDDFGEPAEAVSAAKQRQISRAAACYMAGNRAGANPARFDVVSMFYRGDLPEIELIKDAFELQGRFSI
jgi:putative endonuclease